MLSLFSHVRLFCDPMDCSLLGSSVHGDSRSKNPEVGGDALLQGIFPTQRLNPHFLCLLHWQASSLPLVLPGKPTIQKTQVQFLGQADPLEKEMVTHSSCQ